MGYLLSVDKKKRATVFSELYEFNERLLMNLKYGKIKLAELASDFKYVPAVLEGGNVLSGEDDKFLKNYVVNLGVSDPQSQIDYLNERRSAIKKLADDSNADYKKYSSLYVKIALMLGILIAVLLA